ncbi:M42 family metallopeptidase [Mycoplasma todarodis]|uniref:Aminopeptidase n=1 Tax=Mycoplasma todarodis TaxID=1937191 RepID=A0A4R0XLM5_9MOLU|nr:M42 family metallopeptidase [Mycoplasma todarodis]TCG11596.1 aminopeptidase [Mycoplasma todarodis]
MNKDKTWKILKDYMETDGLSRFEEKVAKKLRNSIDEKAFEITRDRMGSMLIRKGEENGPKIVFAAHMDEVGYLVQDIQKNGQIRLSMVGGIWGHSIVGSEGKIVSSGGKEFKGIFGHTSTHLNTDEKEKKVMELKEMYIDCGFTSKKQAEKAGIEIGDPIYLVANSFRMGEDKEFANGKAMDNRAGLTALTMAIKELEKENIKSNAYFVGTVQEEVGTRGAKTSISIIKPSVAFAVDTCPSHDTYGAQEGTPELGKGVAILIKDGRTMMDPKLVKYVMNIAKKNDIKCYKYVAQGGGTDAGELQYGEGGVATITLSIPQRYLHSPNGMSHLDDIIATSKLIVAIAKDFDSETLDKISYK